MFLCKYLQFITVLLEEAAAPFLREFQATLELPGDTLRDSHQHAFLLQVCLHCAQTTTDAYKNVSEIHGGNVKRGEA